MFVWKSELYLSRVIIQALFVISPLFHNLAAEESILLLHLLQPVSHMYLYRTKKFYFIVELLLKHKLFLYDYQWLITEKSSNIHIAIWRSIAGVSVTKLLSAELPVFCLTETAAKLREQPGDGGLRLSSSRTWGVLYKVELWETGHQ